MKTWQAVGLIVVTISLAAYAGYLQVENASLRDQLANQEDAATDVVADTVIEAPADESQEEVAAESQAEGAAGDQAVAFQELTQEERRERGEERRRQMMETILSRFEDPEARMDLIERNMQRIDRQYAAFFKTLDLSPEEIDVLKTLMAEQGILRWEGQMLSRAAETDEDREAIREDMRERRQMLGEDIDTLLGEEQAKKYDYYTDTLPYRGEVDEFARTMSYSDTPLTNRQNEKLVSAYAKVSKDFEYSVELDQGRGRRNSLTADQVNAYYEEKAVFDGLVLEEAATVLSAEQLASLAEKQMAERDREQRETLFRIENQDTFRGGFGGRGGGGGGGRGNGGGGGGRDR